MSERAITGGLLGLHALTAVHAGAGTSTGVVDLPIARERHTGWPIVPGSSLKGLLRDAAQNRANGSDNDVSVIEVFGPEKDRASEHAGAVSVTDARLIAFPVRSLKGVFAWVTCKSALDRLTRDAALVTEPPAWKLDELTSLQAASVDATPCAADAKSFIFEEYQFTRTDNSKLTEVGTWLAANLLPDTDEYASAQADMPKRLVQLSDTDFTHFARHATEITARIGLDSAAKTVKKGALFYQECLPTESILYAVVLTSPSRKRESQLTAKDVLMQLQKIVPTYMQIGGDETTGKGLCGVRLRCAEGGGQ